MMTHISTINYLERAVLVRDYECENEPHDVKLHNGRNTAVHCARCGGRTWLDHVQGWYVERVIYLMEEDPV